MWLKNTFGGNIKVLQEYSKRNLSYPDFKWNHIFWELKNCSTLRSIDTRLHKAIKQIRNKDNKGGIILDIKNHNNTIVEITNRINSRLYITDNLELIVIIRLNAKLINIIKIEKH